MEAFSISPKSIKKDLVPGEEFMVNVYHKSKLGVPVHIDTLSIVVDENVAWIFWSAVSSEDDQISTPTRFLTQEAVDKLEPDPCGGWRLNLY